MIESTILIIFTHDTFYRDSKPLVFVFGFFRAIEAVRHLPSPVILFNQDGQVVFHNSVSIKVFGPTLPEHNVITLFVDSVMGQVNFCTIRTESLGHLVIRSHILSHVLSCTQNVITDLFLKDRLEPFNASLVTVEGPLVFNMDLRKTIDPVTGNNIALWNMRDITLEENLKVMLLLYFGWASGGFYLLIETRSSYAPQQEQLVDV